MSRRLYGFAHSFHTANLNEDLFGKLRYKEGAHTAGQMNMTSAWHHSSTTNRLKEYGRSEVLVTQALQGAQPAPITEGLFRSKAADFSLDGELLNGFGDGAAFPRLSPATLKLRGVAFEATKVLKGRLHDLRGAWLSQMVSPGSFVHNPHVPESQRGLVG